MLQFIIPIPFRTDRSLRAIPYATYSLLFLCILIHLYALNFTGMEFYQFELRWGLVLAKPSLLTLFTHAFLHADWLHLLSNLLILWIVGTVLEAGIGSLQFLLLYLASMLGSVLLNGAVAQIFQPESVNIPLVGASGAIAGITGFAAFRYYHIRVQNFLLVIPRALDPDSSLPMLPIPYPIWMPFWIYAVYFGCKEVLLGIAGLLSDQMGGVAHWAHVGGLGLGLLTAVMLRSFSEGKRELALEDSARASKGETPQQAGSFEDLQRLLKENPDDPELLEAMAAMALSQGETETSRVLYLKAIPHFFKNGLVERAAVNYLNVLHNFPDTFFEPRQQMALASALEHLRHYQEAAAAFALISDNYQGSHEAETALLRSAQIKHKYLNQDEDAAKMLERLLVEYPLSPWEQIARERLKDIRK